MAAEDLTNVLNKLFILTFCYTKILCLLVETPPPVAAAAEGEEDEEDPDPNILPVAATASLAALLANARILHPSMGKQTNKNAGSTHAWRKKSPTLHPAAPGSAQPPAYWLP
jgi:hypothetical protein